MFFILEISFILLVLCSLNKERFIHSWIKAAMVWCGLLFIHIEIFSIFYILNKYTILAFWMVICILEIIFLIKTRKYLFIDRILKYLIMVTKNNKFLTIVFGMVLLLALFTIPYNWDSMTYHIPRILHWVQNQSVNHYPTHIIRQIATPPFHEFICLDIYILSGNRDIFFNFVQCAAFMTNAWIIYEISIKLGCTKIFSKIGVLLFCSMPIAFAEALTTQNDNLCCMFLLIFLYYLLDFLHKTKKIEDSKENYTKCVIMASCIGFGYLTKPTVTMAMAFLVIVLVAFCIIRRDSLKTIIKLIFMVLPIILAIVLPEMLKNIGTFGAILPPETGSRQLIGTLNPKYVFVNFLKNFCFNLPNHNNSVF